MVPEEDDQEREEWVRLSMQGLEEAYGESEPEYSLDLIKEPKPECEATVPLDPVAALRGLGKGEGS